MKDALPAFGHAERTATPQVSSSKSFKTVPAFVSKPRFPTVFMWSVIGTGAAVCPHLGLSGRDFPLRFSLPPSRRRTLGIGSRLTVKIPRVKSEISVSDTFIFLRYSSSAGPGWPSTLATTEAFCSSIAFSKKRITDVYNCSQMPSLTALTVASCNSASARPPNS